MHWCTACTFQATPTKNHCSPCLNVGLGPSSVPYTMPQELADIAAEVELGVGEQSGKATAADAKSSAANAPKIAGEGMASFAEMWMHADKYDKIMLVLGVIGALGAGLG